MELRKSEERSILKSKSIVFILLIVLLISIDLRFIFLDADPFPYSAFGATWVDEGPYAHNARNYALFGYWKLENDQWNPMYISPIHTYLELIFFRIFGVSTFSARIVSALFGIISIIIAGFFLMRKNFNVGALFMIFILINPMHIAHNRIATIESILLAFILIIISLIIYDNKTSWFFTGLLAPVLFFSKVTSAFFVFAIPTTLLAYSLFYKSKEHFKKLGIFILGLIVSLGAWLFWLIPNFDNWRYMNFEIYGGRIGINLIEVGVIIMRTFEFFLLNPLLVLMSLAIIIYLYSEIRKKNRIEFIEAFLVIALIIFLLQIIFTDYSLARFVLLVPILALSSAKFISKIERSELVINGTHFKFKAIFAILIVLLYAIISAAQLLPFYVDMIKDDNAFVIKSNSEEVGELIPPNSKVYGNQASPLSLENKIMPYHGNYLDKIHNSEDNILPLLVNGQIDYALLKENIFDEADLKEQDKDLDLSKVYKYIRDNFEIVKEIQSKHSRTNEPDKKYIYKRINLTA